MVVCYSRPSPLTVPNKCTKNCFQVTKNEMPSALQTIGWVGFEVSCLPVEQNLLFTSVGHTHLFLFLFSLMYKYVKSIQKLQEISVWSMVSCRRMGFSGTPLTGIWKTAGGMQRPGPLPSTNTHPRCAFQLWPPRPRQCSLPTKGIILWRVRCQKVGLGVSDQKWIQAWKILQRQSLLECNFRYEKKKLFDVPPKP